MATSVTKDESEAALCRGDLATLQRFFAQPSTRAAATRAESWLASQSRGSFSRACMNTVFQTTLVNQMVHACGDASSQLWFTTSLGQLLVPRFDSADVAFDVAEWLFAGGNDTSQWLTESTPLTLVVFLHGLAHRATDAGDAQLLELLLTTETFCSVMNDDQRAQLLYQSAWRVVENGSPGVLLVLVAHGAEVQHLDLASHWGDMNGARLLIEHGTTVVGFDNLFWTSGPTDEFQLYFSEMLRLGADPHTRGEWSWLRAIEGTSFSAVQVLVKEGFVDVDARHHEDGRSALMCAVIRNNIRLVELLLDHNADMTQTDSLGRTPLMLAAAICSLEGVKLLLDRGADPNAADHAGETAVDYARRMPISSYEIVQLLHRRGARVLY